MSNELEGILHSYFGDAFEALTSKQKDALAIELEAHFEAEFKENN